jgi:hypothetical protein
MGRWSMAVWAVWASAAWCASAGAEVPGLDVGVGPLGASTGNFLDEPSEKAVMSSDGRTYRAVYPGFGGLGVGGGLALDVRYLGIVGLELDLLFTNDEGTGEINGVEITLGQSAVHLPILFKLAVPSPLVKPNVFIGWEFVFVGDPKISAEQPILAALEAEAQDYQLLIFGLGAELAPPIEGVDLRFPVSLRGAIHLGDTGKIEDRVEVFPGGAGQSFDSRWQWHIYATLGVMYYFL